MTMVHCPAMMIASIASGQGKTSVTAALARAHSRLGRRVQVFKTGPDFIDPMVLERASGNPVFNLDDRMVGLAESRRLLAAAARTNDLLLVEGAMGLFDGPPSSAALAAALGLPVVVVIDAQAMAQTFGALVQGLADEAARLGAQVIGAVANRVAGDGHARLIAESLRAPQRLWAALPRVDTSFPERHLGLASEDHASVDSAIEEMSEALLRPLVGGDPMALPAPVLFEGDHESELAPLLARNHIAVARDAAFRFIYPANLRLLQHLGAKLSFFSPVADESPPEDADAVWLPGGYPELHAKALATATTWAGGVWRHVRGGKPVLAECGGLMALAETLVAQDGTEHHLVGVLRGRAVMQPRLQALGIQILEGVARTSERSGADPLRGHSFHFARFETAMQPVTYCRRLDGALGEPVWRLGGLTATFFHAYFGSSPHAVAAIFDPLSRGAACRC
jgi:cobyrinic acid a,c-diamide synthase